MQQQYDTPQALRSFLRLCLDPGHGIKRSPEKLAEVMPEPLARKAVEFAPHLGELRHAAQALDEQAKKARLAYADALAVWIHGQDPDPQPASEPTPAPAARRSMPLLEAATAAYDTAVEHAKKCGTCWPGMRLAEMCPDGQRQAVSFLDQAEGEPECAHVAWEVTSEYRNARGMWVKTRKCADCGDPMEPSVEPEPHWPEKPALHPAGDHVLTEARRDAEQAESCG